MRPSGLEESALLRPGGNIEVEVTASGSNCNNKEWRVRSRY